MFGELQPLDDATKQAVGQQLRDESLLDIARIVVVMGTKCSLRCRDCNNLMPLFCPQKDVERETMLAGMTRLFDLADSILRCELIGGEPFLSANLPDALSLALRQPQIHQVEMTTNATILPDERLIPMMQEKKVLVRISDYGTLVKKDRMMDLCEKNHIRYDVLDLGKWLASGGTERRHFSEETLLRGYDRCGASFLCTTLCGRKLYECARSASLHLLGKMEQEESLVIDNATTKRDVRDFILRPYSLACDYCDQTLSERKWVEPAIQL